MTTHLDPCQHPLARGAILHLSILSFACVPGTAAASLSGRRLSSYNLQWCSCRSAVNWQWMEGTEAEASGRYEAAAEAYMTSLQGEAPTKRLPFTTGQSCHWL